MSVLRGGCLCGDIRCGIDGELSPIGHGHCSTLRAGRPLATPDRDSADLDADLG